MTYNREQITGNIGFTSIIDSKFKTNTIKINFITNMSADKAAENSLAVGILATSNSKYKTLAELSSKLGSLYGSSIYADVKKRGDIQILSFGASWLDNRYALENEDITAEMLEIISDCIFRPNCNGSEFDSTSFSIRKNDLLDKIEAEINNKRGYAISKASEIAFKGEPAECSCYGKKENAEAADSSSTYKAYLDLMKNAQIEIFFVAPEDNPKVMKKLANEFKAVERNADTKYNFTSSSPAKKNVENVTEQLDVSQSKLVMAFKSDSDDKIALKFLSTIYGETPFSKLFANVREKLSLCYYCASSYANSKNALFVDSGVEKANVEKAKSEILNQLEEIKKGNFEQSDIDNSVLSLENALIAVGDIPSSYISWYFNRFCEGDSMTPQEICNKYKAVTKERIINAAASLKLDTVYLMTQKEV